MSEVHLPDSPPPPPFQGNSGGPLANLDGEVIGMNNMKAVAADGVSFAIPSDTLKDIVRQFSVHGRVVRPYLGVTLLELTNGGLGQLRQKHPELPLSQPVIVVGRVIPGSPAQEAGLLTDDILLSVGGAWGQGGGWGGKGRGLAREGGGARGGGVCVVAGDRRAAHGGWGQNGSAWWPGTGGQRVVTGDRRAARGVWGGGGVGGHV